MYKKEANHKEFPFIVVIDDYLREQHSKNNTSSDIPNLTSIQNTTPTIMIDLENARPNIPFQNLQPLKITSLTTVPAAEVESLPTLDYKHNCTLSTCPPQALAFDKEYLDLALTPFQVEKAPAPPQRVPDSMRASLFKFSTYAMADGEVFDSSVIKYGPVKAHHSRESTSTAGTHYGSSRSSHGHTPNSSTSSIISSKTVHEGIWTEPPINEYPKAFLQSESPFHGYDTSLKAINPLSSDSTFPRTPAVSKTESSDKGNKKVQEMQSEEPKPMTKSQRKKGRQRKALREQQKAAAASSTSDIPSKISSPIGTESTSADTTKGLATPLVMKSKSAAHSGAPEPMKKSQRKKNRQRKAAGT